MYIRNNYRVNVWIVILTGVRFSLTGILLYSFISAIPLFSSQIKEEIVEQVKKEFPELDTFDERTLNNYAYQLIKQKKMKEAITLFTFNCQLYPDSWNTFDSLGEAYLLDGDTENGILNYKKSLELNPGNTNGKRALEKLLHPDLALFVGNYEFYHEGKYITLIIYIEKGILMGVEPPDDPISLEPLSQENMEFKAEEGMHEYYITFLKDDNDRISGLKWVDGSLTLFAKKVAGSRFKYELTVEEMQEDFWQMRKTLENNHADLYKYTDKETLDKLFEQQFTLIKRSMSIF